MAEGLEGGADGYIARPISDRELLARIASILRLREIEEQYRRKESETREMYELMQEFYAYHEMVYDSSGIAINARILDCNQAFDELFSKNKKTCKGLLVSQLTSTKKPPQIERYKRVSENQIKESFEMEVKRRASGSMF